VTDAVSEKAATRTESGYLKIWLVSGSWKMFMPPS